MLFTLMYDSITGLIISLRCTIIIVNKDIVGKMMMDIKNDLFQESRVCVCVRVCVDVCLCVCVCE